MFLHEPLRRYGVVYNAIAYIPAHHRFRVACIPRAAGVWGRYAGLALLLLALGGCTKAPPNVLVVVFDTLRADRVRAETGEDTLMPFLGGLAQRGFYFPNAHAQSSWTNPSLATIWTSRYQSQHRITSFQSVLADDEILLADVLRRHGYRTGGFVANFLLGPSLGFGRGFDQYMTYSRKRQDANGKQQVVKARAARINREALSWVDQVERTAPHAPVFLYVHYMETHIPYDPPDADVARVLRGGQRADRDDVNTHMLLWNLVGMDDAQVQAAKAYYDAETISADTALRKLLDALRGRHFLDHCVVVIAADHGEEFREHGRLGHGYTLYEEVLRVPLVILAPHATAGKTIPGLVSLIDVAPTVLDLAGIPAPARFQGRSLRSDMGLTHAWPFGTGAATTSAGRPPAGIAISELHRPSEERLSPQEYAVTSASAKLIRNLDGSEEWFDLRSDPLERDMNGVDAADRAKLAAVLAEFMAQGATPEPPPQTQVIDEQTRERMRALGYAH
jgi:arylsulfatase A-like enzyme